MLLYCMVYNLVSIKYGTENIHTSLALLLDRTLERRYVNLIPCQDVESDQNYKYLTQYNDTALESSLF